MKTVVKYLKLPMSFSADLMMREVEIINRGWQLHYNARDYAGDWSAVPLRSVGGSMTNVVALGRDAGFADTELMAQSPFLKSVVESFQCPLMAVRLLRLQSGSVIKEHTDPDLNFEQGEARIHIPVQTHDDVAFYLQGERIPMRAGECWYTNVNLPHRVNNESPVDRIHLVLDCVVNDWLRQLFAANATRATYSEIEEMKWKDEEKAGIIASLRALGTDTGRQLADEMESSGVT
ncbi:MAG: aspartyl/asparaginyl beta-hydroxylase domain-containing protein [Taibaiella sp.]|nr:aspartyl/asparaginyl beta-hydroxylase domain-containing protein [Taibaiella sp.]